MTIMALDNILDILKTMALSELTIASLYRCCAETWKADEAFWLEMESEEIKHAEIINELSEMIHQTPSRFQLNRPFSVAAVRTMVLGIEQNIDQMKKGLITRSRAMIIARDIETSIIEKAYHEIVKTDDPAYLALIRQVASDTIRHRSAIEGKLREGAV